MKIILINYLKKETYQFVKTINSEFENFIIFLLNKLINQFICNILVIFFNHLFKYITNKMEINERKLFKEIKLNHELHEKLEKSSQVIRKLEEEIQI